MPEIILHSDSDGKFKELWIDPALESAVAQRDLWVKAGDRVERFSGANKAIGTLVMNFADRATTERCMANQDWYKVIVE